MLIGLETALVKLRYTKRSSPSRKLLKEIILNIKLLNKRPSKVLLLNYIKHKITLQKALQSAAITQEIYIKYKITQQNALQSAVINYIKY